MSRVVVPLAFAAWCLGVACGEPYVARLAPRLLAADQPASPAAAASSAPAAWPDPDLAPDDVRLNRLQLAGTHNSYHLAPDAVAAGAVRAVAPREAAAIDCSQRPLAEQLERLALRHFELDLFLDPLGGLYAKPLALRLAEQLGRKVPPHDPDGELAAPGIKVLHSPDFDVRTTAYTLQSALRQIKAWSDRRPRHVPIFLLLELKSESFSPATKPPDWDEKALDQLERAILDVIPGERIVTPDLVRGGSATLRDAVGGRGWPTVGATRGKFVFLLDNEDAVRERYLRRSETLKERLLFVSVARNHPAAAWMKRNDPEEAFDEIRELVRDGFLVRTRADAGTVEARRADGTRRDRAYASGAQLISTDFPEPDPRWPTYSGRRLVGRPAAER